MKLPLNFLITHGYHKVNGVKMLGKLDDSEGNVIAANVERENLEYIVKACNMFPELVEVLKKARTALDYTLIRHGSMRYVEEAIETIDKLLKEENK